MIELGLPDESRGNRSGRTPNLLPCDHWCTARKCPGRPDLRRASSIIYPVSVPRLLLAGRDPRAAQIHNIIFPALLAASESRYMIASHDPVSLLFHHGLARETPDSCLVEPMMLGDRFTIMLTSACVLCLRLSSFEQIRRRSTPATEGSSTYSAGKPLTGASR
jgi:hypothetical protein